MNFGTNIIKIFNKKFWVWVFSFFSFLFGSVYEVYIFIYIPKYILLFLSFFCFFSFFLLLFLFFVFFFKKKHKNVFDLKNVFTFVTDMITHKEIFNIKTSSLSPVISKH